MTDYGEDPGEYLECVSTYIGAVPALQAHTVGMLRQLADVRELQGNQTAANHFRALAGSVASEAERLLYNSGKGYWSCLYNNGTLKPVAHSLDFSQLGRHMAVRAENTVDFPVVKINCLVRQDSSRLAGANLRKDSYYFLKIITGVFCTQADLAPETKREMADWAKAELIYEGKKSKSTT